MLVIRILYHKLAAQLWLRKEVKSMLRGTSSILSWAPVIPRTANGSHLSYGKPILDLRNDIDRNQDATNPTNKTI